MRKKKRREKAGRPLPLIQWLDEILLVEDDLDEGLRKRGYAVAELREDYEGLGCSYLLSGGALGDDPERAVSLKQGLEGLSAEAREVVGIVLNCPRELVEFVMGKGAHLHLTGKTLKAWLRWNGWKLTVIDVVFRELKKFVTSL
jgi:hypothetical protein